MKEVQVSPLNNGEYAEAFPDGGTVFGPSSRVYLVPSKEEALKNLEDTFGEVYDPVEEKIVRGGIPQLWEIK